jgi:hypothetical protein
MVGTPLRGILAGLSGLGFVLTFLFVRSQLVSVPIVVAIGGISLIALAIAGGLPAVRRLIGHTTTGDTDDQETTGWWLARVEPALEDSWNTWSDLVFTIGLGTIGLGAFGVLVTSPSNDPPLGLLIVGFLGINGALISLAVAVA